MTQTIATSARNAQTIGHIVYKLITNTKMATNRMAVIEAMRSVAIAPHMGQTSTSRPQPMHSPYQWRHKRSCSLADEANVALLPPARESREHVSGVHDT